MAKKICLVVGLGEWGFWVAKTVAEKGMEVLIVDKDTKILEEALEKIKAEGKVTPQPIEAINQSCFDKLDLEDIKIAVVDLEDQLERIFCTQLLKNREIEEILVKGEDDLEAQILKDIGEESIRIRFPEREDGIRVGLSIIEGVEETIEITPSKEIVKIEIDQKLVGKTLRELNLEERFKVKIVSIISKVSQKQKNGKTIEVEKESEPSPDYQLKSKDLLVIECEKKKVEAIEKEIGAE